MTRTLFLLTPVLLGGLALLVGETFHWFKNRHHHVGLQKLYVQFDSRRG